MSYYDMAVDAGYRGEEAQAVADQLEYEDWLRHQERQYDEADQCADEGHKYHGDDTPAPPGQEGRCYCGSRRYPKGGPRSS